MKSASKSLTLLLILTLAFSIASLTVLNASAADPPPPTYPPDIPTPSVPQFTLTYADHSYDVPAKTTTSIDPYTGNTITSTTPGYRVKNYTIDVTIKNQPYPSTVNNGNTSTLRYGLQTKGHFDNASNFIVAATVDASNSEYTVVSLPAHVYPLNGSVDFRARAYLGFYYTYFYGLLPMQGFANSGSDWSTIQTVTITEAPSITLAPTTPPSTNTPPPTAMPTQSYSTATAAPSSEPSTNSSIDFALPSLNWLETAAFATLGLIVVVLAVFLVLSRRRIKALEMKQTGA
jgi:hypothetical protein